MADPLTYANSDEYVLVNPNDPKVGHLVYDAPMVDAETKQFIRDPETGKIKVYRMVIWGTKGLTQAQVEALITQKNATLVTRINNLDSTLTNFLDADDTTLDQLSELVVAIKANKTDIASLVTNIGKLIDPVSHLPIEATTASVGVVQLATAQDITNGTAGKVVDAQELINFAQTLPAVNGITDVSSGDNSNQLVVSRIGGSKTLIIDNVEHASNAAQANIATTANSVAWTNVSGKPSSYTPSSHTHDDRYYTESEIDTKLSSKVNRIDSGYKSITGDGEYNWCKLATITINSAYVNDPISFEIDGRGILRSIVQIMFGNTNDTDPSLASFTSDVSTDFYIKKVATSKWELYGHYSEPWGSFFLYRVSCNVGGIAIDTTPSNLSSEPSGTTRVSPAITVPTNTNQLTNGAGFITSSGSCNYANSAGSADSVAWSNVSGRPDIWIG